MSDEQVQTHEEVVNVFYPDAEAEPLEVPTESESTDEPPEEAEEESTDVDETTEESEESEASDDEADDEQDIRAGARRARSAPRDRGTGREPRLFEGRSLTCL